MLTDGQTLLKAICADPENDLPRLVYADFLEENGDPDRAAFIRLQVEFTRTARAGRGLDDAIRTELAELWADHEKEWRAELPRVAGVEWDVVFHRGFIERAIVDTDATLRDHADAVLGFTPVHHLCIRRFAGARGVALVPGLRHLKSATVTVQLTDAAIDELLSWAGYRDDLLLILTPLMGEPDAGYRAGELNDKFRRQLHRPLVPPTPAQPPGVGECA